MLGPIYTNNFYTCSYCDYIKMSGRSLNGYSCSLIKAEIYVYHLADTRLYATPSVCPLLIKAIRRRKLKRLNSLIC